MYRLLVFLTAFLLCMHGHAAPSGKIVEIPLKKVYVPHTGFDDNDRIEVVAEGELPNPCFTLGETKAEAQGSGDGYRVRQMAWRRLTGACDSDDLIDDPIPFTSVVALGRLEASSYRVTFRHEMGGTPSRSFSVREATSEEIDEMPYAVVRAVEMEEGYVEGTEVTATIRGFIPSTCLVREGAPRVEVQDDVIVVRPVLAKKPGVECRHVLSPFKETFSVGKLAPGSYLAHVRSRGGNAAYRPFQVWQKFH